MEAQNPWVPLLAAQAGAENTGPGNQEGIASLRLLVRLLAQHRSRQGKLCLPAIRQLYPLDTPLDQRKGSSDLKESSWQCRT